MSNEYGKYSRLAAKQFLADAIVMRAFYYSNVHSNVIYRKPDGSLWHELESHLEYPEDDYTLREVPAGLAQ